MGYRKIKKITQSSALGWLDRRWFPGQQQIKLFAKITMDYLFWIKAQFYTLGFIKEASDLSLGVMYKLQGAFVSLC